MADLNKTMEQINRRIGRLIQQGERDIAKRYARALATIRAELAKDYEKFEQGGQLTLQEMLKHDRLKKLNGRIEFILSKHYKDIHANMEKILKGIYKDGYEHTAWAVETSVKTAVGFSAVTPETLTAMLKNPVAGLTLNQRLQRQRALIIQLIQQQVTQGLQKNESYASMAKRLKGELEGDAVKAMRIVRTEGHRVQESAKHDAMDYANSNGVIMMKQWNSLEDERVRRKPKSKADHRRLNNKKIAMNEFFDDGLSKGLAPGQLPAAASSINCRCFLTYSVEKLERKQVAELEGLTFDQWQKERLIKQDKTKPAAKTATKPKAAPKPKVNQQPNKKQSVISFITQAAKNRFERLTDITSVKLAEKSKRKYLTKLLENAGLSHMKISIKKINANGMVLYYERQRTNNRGIKEMYADNTDFILDSADERPERYRLKTLFHEFYHANFHDLALDEKSFKNSLTWEETATEMAAHWMIREKGFTEMIVPSYGEYLVQNLPRLKNVDEFKDLEKFEDFGAAFMKYRFDDDYKTGQWKWLDDKVNKANKNFDLFGYIDKNYNEFILENIDVIAVDIAESYREGLSKRMDYIGEIKDQIRRGIRFKKHTSGYNGAILWAMKKIGVK